MLLSLTVSLRRDGEHSTTPKYCWQDDARAKIKIAAEQYPFRFMAFKAEAKKRGGGWVKEDF